MKQTRNNVPFTWSAAEDMRSCQAQHPGFSEWGHSHLGTINHWKAARAPRSMGGRAVWTCLAGSHAPTVAPAQGQTTTPPPPGPWAAKDSGPREPLLQPSKLPGSWANSGTPFTMAGSGPTASQKCVSQRSLLLLLSRFSHVWLLPTPWTAAYQAPPSIGFARQEYWSGLPLPSPSEKSRSCWKTIPQTRPW